MLVKTVAYRIRYLEYTENSSIFYSMVFLLFAGTTTLTILRAGLICCSISLQSVGNCAGDKVLSRLKFSAANIS